MRQDLRLEKAGGADGVSRFQAAENGPPPRLVGGGLKSASGMPSDFQTCVQGTGCGTAISLIIDASPGMLDPIYHDLVGVKQTDNGRTGMTAEQVLRCAILKQYRDLSYDELAFHLRDSRTFRSFARLERRQFPSSSTLQENIKALSEQTGRA